MIVRALEALPDDLDRELLVKAETHLVAEAGHFRPPELRRLGRKVLEVVAPDIADAEEEWGPAGGRAPLEGDDALVVPTPRRRCTDVFARFPDHVASRLRAYLDAYTSPRRAVFLDSEVDQLPLARRRGEAFCALLEHVPSDGLPRHGGSATSVMVMIDLGSLRSGLGPAETSTGEVITAAEARRLACTASILPVVLGAAARSSTSAARAACSSRPSARP